MILKRIQQVAGKLKILIMFNLMISLLLTSCTIYNVETNNNLNKGTDSQLQIHYIDVGQGDSTYIYLPNGETILIDAGDNHKDNKVMDYLEECNVKRIDYLIATHPDADHIGGMDDIIDNFEIGNIYMPDITSNTKTFESLLTSIENKNLSINIAMADEEIINEDNLKIKFIAPNEKIKDSNNMSAVLHIMYGTKTFLFMGDAEERSENAIMKEGYSIKADVLKVGHHGSKSSTTEEFIAKVKPKYAIISCGKDNKYGHPSKEVLNRLNKITTNIYRTDEIGTIIIKSDEKDITIETLSTR